MTVTLEVDVEVDMDNLHYKSTGEIIPEDVTLPDDEEIMDLVFQHMEKHDLFSEAEEEIIEQLKDARLTYYDDLYHERKEEGLL